MVDIKQEKLEWFVRESAWEYENVEEDLRSNAPEAAQGAGSALILDLSGSTPSNPAHRAAYLRFYPFESTRCVHCCDSGRTVSGDRTFRGEFQGVPRYTTSFHPRSYLSC